MAGFPESSDFISLNKYDEVPSQGVEEDPPNPEMSLQEVIQDYEDLLHEYPKMGVNLSSYTLDELVTYLSSKVPTTSVEGAFKPDGVPERCVMDHEPTGDEDIVSFPVSSADSNDGLQSPEERGTEIPYGTSTKVEKIILNLSSSMNVISIVKLHGASKKDVESQRTTGDTTVTEPMDEGESQNASTNVTSLSVLPLNKPTCSKENKCSVPQEDGAVEQSRPKKRRANSTNVTGPSILPLNKPSCSKENNSSVPQVDGVVELSRPKKRRAKSESARGRRTMQSRKRSDGKPHLYDMPPFKDPKEEKARIKAVTTRNYRVQEKRQFDEVIDENDRLKEQIADKDDVIDNLKKQIADMGDAVDNLYQ